MDLTNEQLLTHLRDVEVLAEDVLADKQVIYHDIRLFDYSFMMPTLECPWQEIVDLDRKRHRNREAIRAIDAACKSHWAGDDSKTWLAMGNSFFRLPAKKATELLKKGTESLRLQLQFHGS